LKDCGLVAVRRCYAEEAVTRAKL